MVVLNKTFTKHVMQKAISDIFNATANVDNAAVEVYSSATSDSTHYLNTIIDQIATKVNDNAGLLSSLGVAGNCEDDVVKSYTGVQTYNALKIAKDQIVQPKDYQLNFKLVTAKFLKTWDKIYSKVWNESIEDSTFYILNNYITLPVGLMRNQDTHYMSPKRLVERMISAGILDEDDRLNDYDVLDIRDLTKNTTIMNQDTTAQSVTLRLTKTMNIVPDVYTDETDLPAPTEEELYLKDKELYLLYTPHLPNYNTTLQVASNTHQQINTATTDDPFVRKVPESLRNIFLKNYGMSPYSDSIKRPQLRSNYVDVNATITTWDITINSYQGLLRPLCFFKPKVHADGHKSKWNNSLPMFSHLIWRVGTPDQREEAIQKGLPNWRIPDVIVDHVDRISHIDAFEMTIKFDKVMF